jgi:RsiW-degrading membrane proteinase PrsW (M82 family)
MAVIASIFLGFVPMLLFAYFVYWLDRYEKEPKILIGSTFLWGVIIAGGGAFIINTVFEIGVYLFTGSETATDLVGSSLIAPFVEESLKGLAVMVVFLIFYKEFDSILDGIIYAAISALGFAALENTIYIYRGFESGGWSGLWQLVFWRVIVVGWQHPFYTSFTGIGLATARLNRSLIIKIAAPLLGWGTAVFAHALHNTILATTMFGELTCLAGSLLDWSGWTIMFMFVLWAVWREQRNLIDQLRDEVANGSMSLAQYRTATSTFGSSFTRLRALFSGRYLATSRFYQVCGELAHKKVQLVKLGDESGNAAIIHKLRAELKLLAPNALA